MGASLLLLVASLCSVVVDASGHVQVDPAEQAREARGIELLRDANAYFNVGGPDFKPDVAIQKYETVLADVGLLPQLRQDIVFKLADLHRRRGDLSRWHHSSGDAQYTAGTADLEQAVSYYNNLLEDELTAQRPTMRADTLLALGEIQANLNHFEEAAKYNERVQKLAKEISQSPDPKWTPRHREGISRMALSNTINVIQRDRNVRALAREKGSSSGDGNGDLTRFLASVKPATELAQPAAGKQVNESFLGENGAQSSGMFHRSWKVPALLVAGLVLSSAGIILVLAKWLQRERRKQHARPWSGERSK
jgi:tetratricopeptide (TPR) repeat protein